jgi:ComEC/Rec2-related protein
MRKPVGVGEVFGWAGTSFLIGMVAHAMVPERAVPMAALSIIASIAVVIALAFPSTSWSRVVSVCLLACALGVWRYDVSRETQPRGLRPWTPQGLAFVSADVRVADPVDPRYWLGRARTALTERAHQRFGADQVALLTGTLYGERSFSRAAKEDFRRAGLLHLVAVSGSNVTILTVICMRVLLALRLKRRQAFAALTLFLVAFVLFVAPSASVVRAAVMGWLLELAPVVGRLPRPSRLLLVAALAFTFWKPWTLLYDPGFALSFLAMWGLLTIAPWLDERWKERLPSDAFRGILSATVGASVMTLPYAAWAFGQATVIGLVTNLLVLPIIPFVMATGVLALCASPGSWLALPAQGFLGWVLWVAKTAAGWTMGVLDTRGMSFFTMIGWYVFFWVVWHLWKKRTNAYPQKTVIPSARVETV